MNSEKWYRSALKSRKIDYWNFNACLRKNFTKRYNLFAMRTLTVAEGLGLKRIRRLSDDLWYGVLPPVAQEVSA